VVWERLSSRSLPHRRWGSGRKPLPQKPSFCRSRSGFSRDHRVIEDGGLGLKSLFTKHGTLPRLNRSCDEREGSLRPSPSIRRHEPPSFCRSGFRRDPCFIENRRFGSKDHGSSYPISVGQLSAVALLEPHGATRRRRRPLSFSDHSRTCAEPFSTLQRFLSLVRCRIAQMALRRILPLDRRHLLTRTQISDPVSLRNVYPGWPESTFRVYPFTILINCLTNLFDLFRGDRSGKAKQLSPRCALRSLLKHCFHIFKDLFLLLF
jgi:hypothetical protein